MNVGRKTLGVLLRKIIVITVCVYSISTTHQSYAGTTGGLPPITNRLSKSNEKPIIESYRSYSSFLEYKYYAPKKYADQFLGKKASDCDELIVENQTEGTFCLYVFYKTNGNAQDASYTGDYGCWC